MTTTDLTTTHTQTTTEPRLQTPQRTRTPSILLLGAVTALPALSIDAYLPALPSLARDLGTTPAAAQLTLTAVLLGIALGQLIGGPLSDRFGRRAPLLAGLATFVVAAGLCALAPTLPALVALRLLMGVGGGAAVVVARAVVRDRAEGARAARMFARLMLVMGVVPVLAPVLGAQLLRVTSWRGVFAGLVLLGVILGTVVVRRLPETLEEPARRRPARHAPRLRRRPRRPGLRRLRPCRGPVQWRDVRLHLGLALRARGRLRPLAGGLQRRLRDERRRA